jgi:uncharacterized protein (TIGR03118 family)
MENIIMKNQQIHNRWLLAALLIFAFGLNACRDNGSNSLPSGNSSLAMKAHMSPSTQVKYLVADTGSFTGARIDGNLVNAWGIVTRDGNFFVNANGAGVINVYDASGNQEHSAITFPSRDSSAGGAPTGITDNYTADFGGSIIISAGEDGIIATWSSGNSATLAVKSPSPTGVYKGIAMAATHGAHYLYATNFHDAKIDVFDKNFTPVSGMSFTDPGIPAGFAPFGIANVEGNLVITYAMQKAPANLDDQAGPGNGYVDIYSPDGKLIKRLASQGTLNSPWGITTSEDFGGRRNVILIGNFGDGTINAFDMNGTFIGQVKDKEGRVVMIEGLWGIKFRDGDEIFRGDGDGRNHSGLDKLYFAAGPFEENHGTFGYIQTK